MYIFSPSLPHSSFMYMYLGQRLNYDWHVSTHSPTHLSSLWTNTEVTNSCFEEVVLCSVLEQSVVQRTSCNLCGCTNHTQFTTYL